MRRKTREPFVYFGVLVMPVSGTAGIRWCARSGPAMRLADTKARIREMIKQDLGIRSAGGAA